MRKEREIKEKQERLRKAREEHSKAASGNKPSMPDFKDFGAGAGAGKGDFNIPPELMNMFNDPEVQKCFEVSLCNQIIFFFEWFVLTFARLGSRNIRRIYRHLFEPGQHYEIHQQSENNGIIIEIGQ